MIFTIYGVLNRRIWALLRICVMNTISVTVHEVRLSIGSLKITHRISEVLGGRTVH